LFCRHDRHDRPLSFRNQHGRLSSLRSWFKWLARECHVLHNPASELELPKLGHRLPKHVLSQQEAEDILSQTDVANPYTFTVRRLDEETGLFYYRNRYYHAQLGRFVTRGSGWV
jgi:site-specific recombinase XerD